MVLSQLSDGTELYFKSDYMAVCVNENKSEHVWLI